MPGPVPKRSDQRRRTNKVDIDHIEICGPVEVPALDPDSEFIHPIAVDFYDSLKLSGQAQWYEPSDWQRARVLCVLLSDILNSGKPSAVMYTALQHDMAALLVSEADRRRLKMEIDRAPADDTAERAKIAQMDRYRRAAGD